MASSAGQGHILRFNFHNHTSWTFLSSLQVEKNLFHCILMSIGMFIEDSRGTVANNIFQYVANGLDVHRGSCPRMSSNTYTRLAVPGLSGSLSFDIQRVHSGKLEELEAAEIITFK